MSLRPINTTPRITSKSVKITDIDLKTNSISGDIIDGGKITNFSSNGIQDKADNQVLKIENDKITVEKDIVIKGRLLTDKLEYVKAQVPVLDVTQHIRIDYNEVLYKDRLGKSVKTSYLTKVDTLENLEVKNTFYAKDKRVGVNTTVPNHTFAVMSNGVEVVVGSEDAGGYVGTFAAKTFSIGTDNTARITCGANGDIKLIGKTTVSGNLGIGVKNPELPLEVSGSIKFENRTFSSGNSEPTSGLYTKGSIVWNNQPDISKPVGWVCVKGGQPGTWRPFGTIN